MHDNDFDNNGHGFGLAALEILGWTILMLFACYAGLLVLQAIGALAGGG